MMATWPNTVPGPNRSGRAVEPSVAISTSPCLMMKAESGASPAQ